MDPRQKFRHGQVTARIQTTRRCVGWILMLVAFRSSGLAQPFPDGVLASLDLDGDGSADIEYRASADKLGDEPEDWLCGQGLVPLRGSRLLRRDADQIGLERGEVIDHSRPLFSEQIDPTLVVHSLPLLVYRASRFGSDPWEYVTIRARQESEFDLLIGVRTFPSLRYGWMHLTRPVADTHTPFELVRFVVHPVSLEPIEAGMEPGLPILHAESTEDGMVFRWDSRWGQLVLESATRLKAPVPWQQIAIAAGGPVRMPPPTASREFFRLRHPNPRRD